MRKKVTLYIDETDRVLLSWYHSIPRYRRNAMMRIALVRAIQAGIANPEELFSIAEPEEERQREPVSQVSTVKRTQEARADSVPEIPKAPTDQKPQPIAAQDLVEFTLTHLPEGCDARLREVARQYPKPTPYTLEELETLAMLSDGLAQ
ncbi:MAG: hypothetical protein JJ714_09935 [Acidithiobacillus sp.]|nr:hypothetical protein [Acidithiobacillus sp.]